MSAIPISVHRLGRFEPLKDILQVAEFNEREERYVSREMHFNLLSPCLQTKQPAQSCYISSEVIVINDSEKESGEKSCILCKRSIYFPIATDPSVIATKRETIDLTDDLTEKVLLCYACRIAFPSAVNAVVNVHDPDVSERRKSLAQLCSLRICPQVTLVENDLETLDFAAFQSLLAPRWINSSVIGFFSEIMNRSNELNPFGYFFGTIHSIATLCSCSDQNGFIFASDDERMNYVVRICEEKENSGFDFSNKSVAFLPVNLRNQHYALIVYRLGQSFLEVYDSLNPSYMGDIIAAGNIAKEFLKLRKKIVTEIRFMTCPQQENTYDCGAYTMYNCLLLAQHYNLLYTKDSIRLFRLDLARNLLSSYLSKWLKPFVRHHTSNM